MSDQIKIDEVHAEEEEVHQVHIDEFIDLYIEIKKLYLRYKKLKKRIIDEKGEGVHQSRGPREDNIHINKFKTIFSPILREEFKKLDTKEKRELFKTGLLKVFFRLDAKKYQELKDKNKTTDVDKYINKRANQMRFYVKLSNQTKSELAALEESEETDLNYEKFALEAKMEEMIDAIENPEDDESMDIDWLDFDDDD